MEWTKEDDLLLAETVLRHIRENSNQISAFEEVGDKLNRTSAACGFRWNAVVRHNYTNTIELAKKQRKTNKNQNDVRLNIRQLLIDFTNEYDDQGYILSEELAVKYETKLKQILE